MVRLTVVATVLDPADGKQQSFLAASGIPPGEDGLRGLYAEVVDSARRWARNKEAEEAP
jgi:hypothetical protein